jgi:transposase
MTVLETSGKQIEQRRVENQGEVLRAYFAGLPAPVQVAVEACSFWPAFVEALEGQVERLVLVHPARVKAIASAQLKNDKVDSATLAHLLRCDLLPEAWIADPATRELRVRTRVRIELGQMRARVKNRVHALLHRHGLRPPTTDLFGRRGRAWLAALALPEATREALAIYLALLDAFDPLLRQQQQRLEERAGQDQRIRWLTSIPGIGPYGASVILAEVGDIGRFDRKSLFSYAGLVPRVRESAEKSWRGPITRAGSSRLRWIMVEAAVTAVRTSPRIRAWFEHKARHKPRHVVRVALARKLLGCVWALLRDGVCFNEEMFATSERESASPMHVPVP